MAKFVVYADAGGKYRWKLVGSNGQTTASSGESFASKGNARSAAEAVEVGGDGRSVRGVARRPFRATNESRGAPKRAPENRPESLTGFRATTSHRARRDQVP